MQYFDDSATEKMPPKKNEITCLSCGRLFSRLNSHLGRAAECKAFYMNSASDVFVPIREPERETFLTTCAGCGKKFQRILKHLGNSEKCQQKHSIQNEQQLSAKRSRVKKSKSDALNADAKKQHQRERYKANPEPKKNYTEAKYESNPESENQQKKDKYRARVKKSMSDALNPDAIKQHLREGIHCLSVALNLIRDQTELAMAPIPTLPDCSVRIFRLSPRRIEKLTRKVVKRPRGRPRKERKQPTMRMVG